MSLLGFWLIALVNPPLSEVDSARAIQWESKFAELEAENKRLKNEVQNLSSLLKNSTCVPNENSDASTKDILPELQRKVQKLPPPRFKSEEKNLYELALKAIESEDWDEGLLRMEHFVKYFPQSDLADNAVYWMAQIYLHKNETELARSELTRLQQLYPKSDRASQALLLLKDLPQHRGGQ